VNSILEVATLVAAALESCGIRYLIGGSLASAYAGEPRSTLDIDFVVDITIARVPGLAAALGADFYFDAQTFAAAIRSGTSVNAIHEPSGIKVDFFIAHSKLDRQQMDRRILRQIGGASALYFYTAEDILLQKLIWFRLGGETSDRQWRDILGIVVVQGPALDRAYLKEQASALDLDALLAKALDPR